ncbi:MAG: hypothetical protein OES09_07955 [Gammaproteobacteria bacterium]|nr:hypothetical protein [Gammaproteobacteria bacterium]
MSIGLTFKETMKGNFSVGAQEPEEGAERGEQEGLELQMDATVTIEDLDRFIDDPNHLGGLKGSISFPPYGDRIASQGGVFNLFSPGDNPGLKLMVYELGVQIDGTPHYFSGHKRVRNNSGSDLWSDTTTLYSTVHAGLGKDAPVVAAGIIRLGVLELKDLLITIRVAGAGSHSEQLGAIAKFGKFFLGELWDTYAPFATDSS